MIAGSYVIERGGDRLDLNLVRLFVAIYESRSLTLVASQLFVTQPAVSKALARLRDELGDPLFQRVGRRMVPTELADALYPEFREAIALINNSLATLTEFDPSRASRVFRIALSELGQSWFLPPVLHAMNREAPNSMIEVIQMDISKLPAWLSTGYVDLGITSSGMPNGFNGTTIMRSTYAAAFSTEHAIMRSEISLEEYLDARHIVITGDTGKWRIDSALERHGRTITPALMLPNFIGVPPIVAQSDLVATIPIPVTQAWAAAPSVRFSPLPFQLEPTVVRLFRRTTSSEAAARDWFMDLTLAAIREVVEL